MCGIAGYSLSARSGVDRTLAAQALLAGIAERGADAVGYAYRGAGAEVIAHKQRSGASALLDRIAVPEDATQLLVHVRDYTKGHPRIEANNHPIRHGAVVGIHNGIVFNDEEIFAAHRFRRAHPEMTVDSEAIFALLEASHGHAHALEECHGSLAIAWLDERRPNVVYCARGIGRPLWIGRGRHETFFASTRRALEVVERYAGVPLAKRELYEGALLALEAGRVAWRERFRPDGSFVEEALPAVRAPHEAKAALALLAALAA
jgi:glucosamine 6-phosphate synthetase-like amidotransferase/phosphosugar isomerase protein